MNPMRNQFHFSPRLAWLVAAFVSVSGLPGFAQQTNGPARPDYSSFKIITDRNIFNPNRSSKSARVVRSNPQQQVKGDAFSLLGTMSYEKGLFAFFDGTSSDYRKVLQRADAIAGYKVTDIAPNCVKLGSGTNELELRVGMQMRREEEGGWLLVAQAEPYANQTAAADAESAAASGGEENDVLKKLMQRREQELNR